MCRVMVIVLCMIVVASGSLFAQTDTKPVAPAVPVAQTEPVGLMVETQMCTGVAERMPVDSVSDFPAGTEQVFLWCHVTGATDSTSITMVWSNEGEERATVEFPVKSPSWRTWGSKKLLPSWTGNWEVKILDSQGEILKAVDFTVGEAKEVPTGNQ